MDELNETLMYEDESDTMICDEMTGVCWSGSLFGVSMRIVKSCRHLRILLASRDLNDGPRRALAESFNQGSSENPH